MTLTLSEYERLIVDEPLVACQEAAFEAGITDKQAEECNDGDCNCPACPWKDRLSLHFANPQDVV